MARAPHLTKFCFASESCIPVVSVHTALTLISHHQNQEISDTTKMGKTIVSSSAPSSSSTVVTTSTTSSISLKDDGCSWIKWSHHASNGYAQQQQFEVLRKVMPAPLIVKGKCFFILTTSSVDSVGRFLS